MQRAGRPNGAKQEKRRSVSIFTQSRPSLPLFCSNNNRLLTFFLQKIVLRPKGGWASTLQTYVKSCSKKGAALVYPLPAGCASLTRYRIGGGVGSGRQWPEQGGLIQVDSQGSHGTLVSQAPIPCLAPLFSPKMTIEVFLLHMIEQNSSLEIPGNHHCCLALMVFSKSSLLIRGPQCHSLDQSSPGRKCNKCPGCGRTRGFHNCD